MNLFRLLVAALLVSFLSGCIAPKSYVDPKYNGISVSDIQAVKEKHLAAVDVEFMRNGQRFAKVDKELRNRVESALVKSGVVSPSSTADKLRIKVVCNNIADLDAARKQGFGVGLTFGAKGTAVTDYYQVTIEMRQGDSVVEKKYDHAIHTTIGNKAAPVENVAPSKPADAFGGVIDDVILQFIKDMQGQNLLTLSNQVVVKKA